MDCRVEMSVEVYRAANEAFWKMAWNLNLFQVILIILAGTFYFQVILLYTFTEFPITKGCLKCHFLCLAFNVFCPQKGINIYC